MVQTDRITIIVDDNTVYLDVYACLNLDLSSCGIPEDVHAFNWFKDKGEIEYRGVEKCNEPVTEIPEWAIKAVGQWEIEIQNNPPPPVEDMLPN